MSKPLIQAIEPHHVQQARNVIITVVVEIFYPDEDAAFAQRLHEAYEARKELDDITDYENHYNLNDGLFLILVDGEKVVGTGAIRKLDTEIAELKRMWFLPPYRGRGLGTEMAKRLLAFARSRNYRRVRLDTDKRQTRAAALYQRLGFRYIERYNQRVGGTFMELDLTAPNAGNDIGGLAKGEV